MSASLVRKALDETSFASEEKLDQLSKASKKKFKPKAKKKKLSIDKILKQNLKILKALEYTGPSYKETSSSSQDSSKNLKTDKPGKRSKKKKPEDSSVFTEEDFEKFEKEYFVS